MNQLDYGTTLADRATWRLDHWSDIIYENRYCHIKIGEILFCPPKLPSQTVTYDFEN